MNRLFVSLILTGLTSGPAFAQALGSAAFRTESQEKEEFIQRLRRDIAKVAHSVDVTKELIARSRGAPFLPDIHLRLAELYVEQARYEFYLVHEQRGEESKGSAIAPTARLLKEKAVETYQRILADFPAFVDRDRVLFFLAHEHRELGQYERMISTYEKLVSQFPKSPLVLDAYLVLGDYRFDKADLLGAKGYYQRILDSPKSETHPMAYFKMGWVYLNETNYREALHHFENAILAETENIANDTGEKGRVVNVQREALMDLAFAYTEVRKPAGALKYFRGLAESRGNYLLALHKLARRYFVKQNFPAAAQVYREVVRLSHDAESNLDFANRIYEASKTSNRYIYVDRDVATMLRALDAYRFDWRIPAAQRDAAAVDIETLARDFSTRAHSATQGRGADAKNRLGPRVAEAYRRYLETFPESAHRADIVENLANTLFDAKMFLKAGDRYAELAQLATDETVKEKALYNACAAFHEGLKGQASMDRFDRIWAQQGLIKNGAAYVSAFPSSERVPEIKLNIGRSYYESGDYPRAVGVFDEFVAAYPHHPNAVQAADLILDAHANEQDFEALAAKARSLGTMTNLGDERFRRRMRATAQRAEERQIGEVILTASVRGDRGLDAGEQLRRYWETNQSSPVAEKTLYTAFVQYKEARNFAKTFETGNQFIGAYPNSQYLGDIFGTLASFATETGEFEQAAVYLDEYYKRFPEDPTAQRMLAQAAKIERLIGDHRAAARHYELLIKVSADEQNRARYASLMLRSYEALNEWEGIRRSSQRILAHDSRNVSAYLMLGLAADKAGNLAAAASAFSNAVRAAGRTARGQDLEDAARAAYMLGDVIYKELERAGTGADLATATELKATLLGRLEEVMVDAVGYNRGRWAVAALHRLALAYARFAAFLQNAPVPTELEGEERTRYMALVKEQANDILVRATELFDTCLQKARELNVFTGAVLGCVKRGPEETIPPVTTRQGRPPDQRYDELKEILTRDPRDLDGIAGLADYFLMTGQPAKAKLIAARGAELDGRDGRFPNKIGMADLMLGDPQAAFHGFAEATNLSHPYAAINEVALRTAFGDQEGASQLVKRHDLDELPRDVADLHPAASEALQAVTR